jgi:AhpD family alkylhydroperoxidase
MNQAVPAIFADWPGGVKAMLAVDVVCDSQGLSPRLLELVRLWCSILNDCGYCIGMHRAKAAMAGVAVATLDSLAERQENVVRDEAERTALAYASALTSLSNDEAIAHVASALPIHFDRHQISVLTTAIAQINAWNRMLRADEAMSPNITAFLK